MPNPEGQITVGIDGTYVRSRDAGQSHFEVTVGKSIPSDRLNRYLGLAQSHDAKPKWRLHEVLKEQDNQPVTFMTDSGDTVINMAQHMAPASEHILDRFHIIRRITVMLHTRTRTLDGAHRGKFEHWYPGMKTDAEIKRAA